MNYAIILASGAGERTGLNVPKQFVLIENKSVLERSIEAFENHSCIDKIILVINPLFTDLVHEILAKNKYSKINKILTGGKTRQISSYIGVNAVEEQDAKVLIHDAARPFVSAKIINDCLKALDKNNAVNVAIETSDTIIEVNENNIIKKVSDRKRLRRCQTPQCFDINLIKKAHELAKKDGIDNITDDCGLILKYNLSDIYVVEGSVDNIKITYPIDLEIAKLILKKESN